MNIIIRADGAVYEHLSVGLRVKIEATVTEVGQYGVTATTIDGREQTIFEPRAYLRLDAIDHQDLEEQQTA